MKRSSLIFYAPFALVLLGGAAGAQETGYVNGSITLFSFNPSNGAIVGSFSGAGTDKPFAVANDDVALYLPFYGEPATAVYAVSGTTGQMAGSVAISGLGFHGLALTKDGTKAYVPSGTGVSVIDTATLSIVASIVHYSPASDVALSPDDSTLYMSVDCPDGCDAPAACPVKVGVCAFNASTLALAWKVKDVSGLLSVSNDGSYLYAASAEIQGKPQYPLNAINTATQAVTNLGVDMRKDTSPLRIITDPASHYAVVFEQSDFTGSQTPASAYILDTSTNTFVKVLFASAPGGMAVPNAAGGAAFAPDGKSVWMLLSCGPGFVPNCSDESGQIYLAGFNLPSGTMISNQALPGQFWTGSEEMQSIAFPR